MTALALAGSSHLVPAPDLNVGAVVLDVLNRKLRGLDTRIDGSITGGELERTIEGASTLSITVHDPRRFLLRSGMFDEAIDLKLDGLFWRLVKVAKTGDELSLVFEDREVAYLRENTSARKAARSSLTRAEFALSLVREVRKGGGIRFICPELHVKQPIEKRQDEPSDLERTENRDPGISRKAYLTIKGKKATPAQLRILEQVLDVARTNGADMRATKALVEACIVESLCANLAGGDADSRGVLQVRDQTARSLRINNRDVAASAKAFLQDPGFTSKGGAITVAREHPNWSPGRIAQEVQGSAHPDRYDKQDEEASAILEAYEGDFGSTETTIDLPYQFQRGGTDGETENSWQCLQRLAGEVQWRCFMSAGALYFISETALMKAKPRLVLSESDPAVSAIDFDIDNGKANSEVTVTARASRWIAAPGAVVELKDCGPANGRWLVATLHRGLFDAQATITLRRVTKPLAEPANEQATVTTRSGDEGVEVTTGSGVEAIDLAYSAAKSIDAKRYPYVWGGGHKAAGSPDHGVSGHADSAGTIVVPRVGYDCSGSTAAVLAAAGLGFEPGGPTKFSGDFGTWGAAGPGKYMTVYCNNEHVFIVFEAGVGPSGKAEHFGTGDWGKGWSGPGFNPNMHHFTGFTARHWPGL